MRSLPFCLFAYFPPSASRCSPFLSVSRAPFLSSIFSSPGKSQEAVSWTWSFTHPSVSGGFFRSPDLFDRPSLFRSGNPFLCFSPRLSFLARQSFVSEAVRHILVSRILKVQLLARLVVCGLFSGGPVCVQRIHQN